MRMRMRLRTWLDARTCAGCVLLVVDAGPKPGLLPLSLVDVVSWLATRGAPRTPRFAAVNTGLDCKKPHPRPPPGPAAPPPSTPSSSCNQSEAPAAQSEASAPIAP